MAVTVLPQKFITDYKQRPIKKRPFQYVTEDEQPQDLSIKRIKVEPAFSSPPSPAPITTSSVSGTAIKVKAFDMLCEYSQQQPSLPSSLPPPQQSSPHQSSMPQSLPHQSIRYQSCQSSLHQSPPHQSGPHLSPIHGFGSRDSAFTPPNRAVSSSNDKLCFGNFNSLHHEFMRTFKATHNNISTTAATTITSSINPMSPPQSSGLSSVCYSKSEVLPIVNHILRTVHGALYNQQTNSAAPFLPSPSLFNWCNAKPTVNQFSSNDSEGQLYSPGSTTSEDSGIAADHHSDSDVDIVGDGDDVKWHNGVRFPCNKCGKEYSTSSGLSKHSELQRCTEQGSGRSFACSNEYCDKVYTTAGALKMHIKTHTLPCKCNLCGKSFSRPWLLQGHIRTHTGEKPFQCNECCRSFADRSNLRAHQQTHETVKKYACTACSKTFSRMSLLNKHKEGPCQKLMTKTALNIQ